MNQIHLSATFPNVPSDNLAEFKQVAAQALDITRGEAGTPVYAWFFYDDETMCVVREIYEDSDAVLAHIGNLGEVFGKLLEVGGGCKFKVFGNPSAQLREAVEDWRTRAYPA
jgi:quinol monooxygenase YgiN